VHPPPPTAQAQAQAHDTQAHAQDTQALPPEDDLAGAAAGGALAAFRMPRKDSTPPTTPADVFSTEVVKFLANDSTLEVVWFVG
jgi:hypothetical protein